MTLKVKEGVCEPRSVGASRKAKAVIWPPPRNRGCSAVTARKTLLHNQNEQGKGLSPEAPKGSVEHGPADTCVLAQGVSCQASASMQT